MPGYKLPKTKIYILLFGITVILLFTGCSSSNPAITSTSLTVEGTITDYNTGEPVTQAKIFLDSTSQTSDEDGFYRFVNIDKGMYQFGIKAGGYYSYSEELDIYQDKEINKQLVPSAGGGLITGEIILENTSQDYPSPVSISPAETSNNTVKTSDYSSEIVTNYISRINGEKYKRDEILLKLKDGVKSLSAVLPAGNADTNFKIISTIIKENREKFFHLKLNDGKTVEEVLQYFRKLPCVEWAQPNYLYYPAGIPQDEHYPEQWGHHRINLEGARDYIDNSNTTTVAVIDTGILPEHPDLAGNVLQGADFAGSPDPELPHNMTDMDPLDEIRYEPSHGTHVAGIVAAVTDNNAGIAGVSKNTKILPLKIFDSSGFSYNPGSTDDIIEAIEYAIAMDVDIINLSLAGTGDDNALQITIQDAVNNGIIVVAAAGNSGDKDDYKVKYPAAFPEVIAVGSTNYENNRSYFSSYGEELELVAPGSEIISTSGYKTMNSYTHDYFYMSGTSMSTPYVSGVAALLVAGGHNNVRNILQQTAIDLGREEFDTHYGYGLIDAYAALRGEPLPPPSVCAAFINGSEITPVSEVITGENNSYQIPGISPGEYYLVTFRDMNNNGLLETGEYFGQSNGEIIVTEDATTTVDLNLYYIDDKSPYNGLYINN